MRRRRFATLFLLLLLSAGCAGVPAVPPARISATPDLAPVSLGWGPPTGATFTQELTSTATVTWEGRIPGRENISETRDTGLRFTVFFTVTERIGNTGRIKADIRDMEIIQGGRFVKAPFLQFSPPSSLSFLIDFSQRTADFSNAREAWQRWFEGLRGTPIYDILAANFDIAAFANQLRDLLVRPAADFPGKRYVGGTPQVQSVPFSASFLGPAISLGPVGSELNTSLSWVQESGGRRLAAIQGKQSSTLLVLSPNDLLVRFRHLGKDTIPTFTSRGNLAGTMTAVVDVATGWTTAADSTFTAEVTAKGAGLDFKETIVGRRLLTTID